MAESKEVKLLKARLLEIGAAAASHAAEAENDSKLQAMANLAEEASAHGLRLYELSKGA